MSHADIRTIVIGVGVAMFLGALDQTIIAAALPAIAGDLGDFSAISWVASIYLLTATAVTPLYGKFSDIKGRRTALSLGVAVAMPDQLVTTRHQRGHQFRAVVVQSRVDQRARGQAELVKQFQATPGAHPVAVLTPAVVQDVGLR
jgi:anti-sigma factor RsiW